MEATLLNERELTKIGKALAEPRRVKILHELGAAPDTTMACSALASIEDVSASTATHHVQELENAGLVEISRQGKFSFITFKREKLAAYLEHMAGI
jgi:ArsR family transcriptional regulator